VVAAGGAVEVEVDVEVGMACERDEKAEVELLPRPRRCDWLLSAGEAVKAFRACRVNADDAEVSLVLLLEVVVVLECSADGAAASVSREGDGA